MRRLLLCCLLLIPLGCRSRAVIDSVPQGALVTVDGVPKGLTPLVVEMHAHHWYGGRRRVLVEKAGFRSRYGALDTRYDARHLWLSPLVLTIYGTAVVVHPAMCTRLKDHYLIILDEDDGSEQPLELETFYGRVFTGSSSERERQRQHLLMEAADGE